MARSRMRCLPIESYSEVLCFLVIQYALQQRVRRFYPPLIAERRVTAKCPLPAIKWLSLSCAFKDTTLAVFIAHLPRPWNPIAVHR